MPIRDNPDPASARPKDFTNWVDALASFRATHNRAAVGAEAMPDSLDIPLDEQMLARRFLESLGNERRENWIIELAQTPGFDEPAARALFSSESDAAQDQAWNSLREYGMTEQREESPWFRIHPVMARALHHRQSDDPAEYARTHEKWEAYWRSRAQTDGDAFASLAWYHLSARDPWQAVVDWQAAADRTYQARQMAAHRDLLEWWRPMGIETREPRSSLDAHCLCALGYELERATHGDRSENVRRAIACHQSALRVYTESEFPFHWAMTQENLGFAYQFLPTDTRDENLHRAVNHYESALRVYTESAYPSEWARIQLSLGKAYRILAIDTPAKNLDRAVACCRSALRVYTETAFPSEWAELQFQLGFAGLGLPSERSRKHLQRAIPYLESALRVRTESAFPFEWAMTQFVLGLMHNSLACSLRPTRDADRCRHRGIAHFESALRVYTESVYPYEWAMAQSNLALIYRSLLTGDRGENLHRAIAHSESALRVYTESALPSGWTALQQGLGDAYRNLPTGDRRENLHRALAYFKSALRVYTETAFPFEWATVQSSMGSAYVDLEDFDASILAGERSVLGYERAGDKTSAKRARYWLKLMRKVARLR